MICQECGAGTEGGPLQCVCAGKTRPVEGFVHIFRVTREGEQGHGHPDILGISLDGSQLALRNMQWVDATAYAALYKQFEEGLAAWKANSQWHAQRIAELEAAQPEAQR